MRRRVFACFSAPFDDNAIAAMVENAIESADWRDSIELISGSPHWVTRRVSSRLVTAERLVLFMKEYRSDLPADERDELMLAFREVLVNAMEHGAGFDPEKVVVVTAARTQRAIVYHFRDPGPVIINKLIMNGISESRLKGSGSDKKTTGDLKKKKLKHTKVDLIKK